eukprot:TRINITY_DN3086_c0_g1::TRINITY_DN3086_c0_g1_i1::g.22292::m.22292 TRINITY_DN3086_c0_g1::TRINITY_DN3086_c0_g1_i1::g.22292  ORF type:complete len:770 (-),score=158.77,sp/Q6BQT6/SEC23_DEBHA/22.49/5e-13,Sec23_trunk/PF04811.10/1e-05,Sec23_trunk/PF04811.10/2.9e-10,Sec23_helical/PF04815.10/1.6e-07,Sec23_helical/PF04815.10/6.4e+02,zf-Sec23_Sec24/PF04810.10/0.0022 TRINITY_DN3086_c0_g1_i1:15-2324(-)
MNSSATFEYRQWVCPVCSHRNPIKHSRYASQANRVRYAETSSSIFECEITDEADDAPSKISSEADPMLQIYIAVVDLSGDEEFIELAQGGLNALLEAIPENALFGLITFSDFLGIYDLHNETPIVQRLMIPASGPMSISLHDVAPIRRLCVPIGQYKQNIQKAIESLDVAALSRWEQKDSPLLRPRALGSTLTELITLFGESLTTPLEEGQGELFGTGGARPRGFARFAVMLSGMPNFGLGSLSEGGLTLGPREKSGHGGGAEDGPAHAHTQPQPQVKARLPPSSNEPAALKPCTDFYFRLGERAAESSVSVDIFIATQHYIDLASLEGVSVRSGGRLFLYDSAPTSTLPQDIFRYYSLPTATSGVLRIRTCPQIGIRRAWGALSRDSTYPDIYHLPACTPHTSFSFSFEFINTAGFVGTSPVYPCIQLAYAYTVTAPDDAVSMSEGTQTQPQPQVLPDGTGSSPSDPSPKRPLRTRRILRVETLQFESGRTHAVLNEADCEPVFSLLLNMGWDLCLSEGVNAARDELRDWLLRFMIKYHKNTRNLIATGKQKWVADSDVDVGFAIYPNLDRLTRLVYALINAPLFRPDVSADQRIYLRHLWTMLPPPLLLRALYPYLVAFENPNEMKGEWFMLSREAVETSTHPIFMLDAYDTIVVMYLRTSPDLPFPPPRDSLLWRMVEAAKQDRGCTPRVVKCEKGTPDERWFYANLIEDQGYNRHATFLGLTANQPPKPDHLQSYETFCEQLKANVREALVPSTTDEKQQSATAG